MSGCTGQLGHEVARDFRSQGHEVHAPGREQMNLENPADVASLVRAYAPDWIINCAAYTQVDKAESEPQLAFSVNRDSPAALATAVAATGGRLLQVSTDFIFDGTKTTPYREDDKANPLGVYGQSKLEGERAVLAALPGATVVRTAWVYGAHGSGGNFVKTMLRLATTGKPLRVVSDQVGSPTWTTDLSAAILALVGKEKSGVFNYTNAGETSWHGFATAILSEAAGLGFDIKTEVVEPIPTSGYPTAAARPAYSVLDTHKIRNSLGLQIPSWRDSLVNMLKELRTCADC
ncbi:MAG: dTDP-4-dehydrorhamnose reductase [Gammaproteobacteria bacterium]